MSTKKPVQKVAVACALIAAVIGVTEGYLRIREFVVEVHNSSRQLAALKHEVETLQITLDNTPRTRAAPIEAAGAQLASMPVPEPMSEIPLPAPAPRKAANPAASAASADSGQAPKDPDDGRIVLLTAVKNSVPAPATSAQAPAAVPAQVIKLLSDHN